MVRSPGISSGGSHYCPWPKGTSGVTESMPSVQCRLKSGRAVATAGNTAGQEGSRKETPSSLSFCLILRCLPRPNPPKSQRAVEPGGCSPQELAHRAQSSADEGRGQTRGRKLGGHVRKCSLWKQQELTGLK